VAAGVGVDPWGFKPVGWRVRAGAPRFPEAAAEVATVAVAAVATAIGTRRGEGGVHIVSLPWMGVVVVTPEGAEVRRRPLSPPWGGGGDVAALSGDGSHPASATLLLE